MEEQITYSFWFWQNKSRGILAMLELLAGYNMNDVEPDVIKHGLTGTSDEDNIWFNWRFSGKKHTIHMRLAYDKEEGPDMIIIEIKTDIILKEKIEALDIFQSLFKELDLDI